MWDRSDIDDGGIDPSTPSKAPRFVVEDDDPSPLANSSQAESQSQSQVPATPFVPETPPPAWPSEGTDAGDDDFTTAQGKRPAHGRKTPKKSS
jgi:hypothetical protein